MRGNLAQTILQNKDTYRLMRVALGHQPAQTAIINARVVNVYTAEVLSGQTILIDGAWIAYVGEDREFDFSQTTQVIDAAGKVIIPGLIDGHTHLAWFFSVPEFLKAAIPGGTTTIITECMETYPIAGFKGVCDFLASLADQPIKIFATAPAMASISQQTIGIRPEDLQRLLQRRHRGFGRILLANGAAAAATVAARDDRDPDRGKAAGGPFGRRAGPKIGRLRCNRHLLLSRTHHC